jgi:hypothetical protein
MWTSTKLFRRWGAACLIGFVVVLMVFAKVTRQIEPGAVDMSLDAAEKAGD